MNDELIENNVEQPVDNGESKMEPNVKPAISMRIAGGLLDIGLVFLATFGFHSIITSTPLGQTLSNYRVEMINIQDEYKLQTLVEGSDETYGHKAYEGSEEYVTYSNFVKHTDEAGTYVVVNNQTISQSVIDAFNNSVKNDASYKTASFNYRFVDFGYLCLASGVAELILILGIPLIHKKRSTIGKMLAGTYLVHKEYCTPPKWYQILGRFLLIYLFETVLPYLAISNILAVILVPIILFIISLFNKQNRTITDYITRTRLIDKRSVQPITQRRGRSF